MILTDDAGIVEIELKDLHVESVRISNRWKDLTDAATLASTISSLLRGAIPSPGMANVVSTTDIYHLPPSQVRTFINEMRAGHKATRRYITQLNNGEIAPPESREIFSGDHVAVLFVGTRFHSLQINGEWANTVAIQKLCDEITDVLSREPLNTETPKHPDLIQAEAHFANAKNLLIPRSE